MSETLILSGPYPVGLSIQHCYTLCTGCACDVDTSSSCRMFEEFVHKFALIALPISERNVTPWSHADSALKGRATVVMDASGCNT